MTGRGVMTPRPQVGRGVVAPIRRHGQSPTRRCRTPTLRREAPPHLGTPPESGTGYLERPSVRPEPIFIGPAPRAVRDRRHRIPALAV